MRTLITWRSLQARLLLGAILWVSVGLAASGLAVSALFRDHVTAQFSHELNDHLTELQNLYAADTPAALLRPVSDPRFGLPGSGYYWEIFREDVPLLRSPSLEGRDLRTDTPRAYPLRGAVAGSETPLRMYERTSRSGNAEPVRFLMGADESALQRTIARFDRLLAGSLAIVALGLAGAAIAQIWIGLRPLRRLRTALSRVRSGEAGSLPPDFPSEVQPLVNDLNEVIRANGEMIQRARAQAGNLSHALRSHLAILTDNARRLRAAGHVEAAAAILAECQAMSRQVDYQMARARAAAPRAVIGASVAPAAIAGEILSALGRLHGGRAIVLTNDIPPDLRIACDPDDLSEMLANLADNSAKWARRQVRLQGEATANGMARLIVDDDGPGLPEDRWESVFQLGVRLDERVGGGGLGLTIVRDLADLYGGRVYFTHSELGGARAVLELPRPDGKGEA